MVNWNFNSNDYEEKSFTPIPVGDHRVRISSAKETQSSNNNQMIELTLDVSGYNSTIWYYLVFMPDNQKITNQKLGEIFNSFGITPGDFNLANWVGKIGAAKVKHEDYNGEPRSKIAYFINKNKQEKMPAWVEPQRTSNSNSVPFEEVSNADVPF